MDEFFKICGKSRSDSPTDFVEKFAPPRHVRLLNQWPKIARQRVRGDLPVEITTEWQKCPSPQRFLHVKR